MTQIVDPLQEKVNQLTRELSATNQQLDQSYQTIAKLRAEMRSVQFSASMSNKARSEFVGKLAHDLREFSSAILYSAELLAQEPASSASPRHREHFHDIRQGARDLLSLTGDILEILKHESGNPDGNYSLYITRSI